MFKCAACGSVEQGHACPGAELLADLAKCKAVAGKLNAALAPIVFVFDETDKHGGLIQFEALERASIALHAYQEWLEESK